MINIIICGAAGKMGSSISRLAAQEKELKVAGCVEKKDFLSKCPQDIKAVSSLSEIISSGDVIIDFTAVSSTLDNLSSALKAKKPMVIGTTGFGPADLAKIKQASEQIPIVFSPNMSIGVNLLFKLVAEASSILKDYDAEIVELHHNQKKDAPSGTAAKLAEVIAGVRGKDLEKSVVSGRKGLTGPRGKDEIGVLSVRAGDIVGDHTVYFAGPGERLELTHRAHSRDTLAQGALTAAKWLSGQKPGLYDMQDVLGLKQRTSGGK